DASLTGPHSRLVPLPSEAQLSTVPSQPASVQLRCHAGSLPEPSRHAMSVPAQPAAARATCIYDRSLQRLLVAHPTGTRCTFSYDSAKEPPAALAVTAGRAAWTPALAYSTPEASNAPLGSPIQPGQYDSSGALRLSNAGAGRTTFVYDVPRVSRANSAP